LSASTPMTCAAYSSPPVMVTCMSQKYARYFYRMYGDHAGDGVLLHVSLTPTMQAPCEQACSSPGFRGHAIEEGRH
jgi:hypothetical protein